MIVFIIVWLEDKPEVCEAPSRYWLEAETIRNRARGSWLGILGSLAPELEPALQRLGRHVPCPIHGGRDGFRLFRDAPDTGGGICNTCGAFPDGFASYGTTRSV